MDKKLQLQYRSFILFDCQNLQINGLDYLLQLLKTTNIIFQSLLCCDSTRRQPMIDQRFGIDIVFILNLSRIKSVYVVFYLLHPQSNIERHKNGSL